MQTDIEPVTTTGRIAKYYAELDARIASKNGGLGSPVNLPVSFLSEVGGNFTRLEPVLVPVYKSVFALERLAKEHPRNKASYTRSVYSVTHVGTGLLAGQYTNKQDALRLIYLLTLPETGVDWSFTTIEYMKQLDNVVQHKLREIRSQIDNHDLPYTTA